MSTVALVPQQTRRRRPVVDGVTTERLPVRACSGEELGWQPVAARPPLRLTRRGRALVTLITALVFGAAVLVIGLRVADALTGEPYFTQTVQIQVGAGQTLWSIAEQTNPTEDPRLVIDEIAKLNGLRSAADLEPGQTLTVPTR
jgi:LysM domain